MVCRPSLPGRLLSHSFKTGARPGPMLCGVRSGVAPGHVFVGESLEIVRDLMKEFLKTGVDLDALCLDVARR